MYKVRSFKGILPYHYFFTIFKTNPKIVFLFSLYKQRLFSSDHFLQTLLFGLQLCISYILMLVFMTFSIWLCLAVCLGTATGYLLFGAREISQFNPDVTSRDPAQH